MGRGSAQVNAHYAITPDDGIAARVGDRVQLLYEIGCTNHKLLPRLDGRWVRPLGGATRRAEASGVPRPQGGAH